MKTKEQIQAMQRAMVVELDPENEEIAAKIIAILDWVIGELPDYSGLNGIDELGKNPNPALDLAVNKLRVALNRSYLAEAIEASQPACGGH